MEQNTGQKESAVRINATDVMQSFEGFEERAKEGFITQEESLAAYGKFIATATNFFQQSGIESLPQTRNLVDRLFYQHEYTASLPLEFFLRVKGGLNKDVLANGSIPRGEKTWNSELSFIKSETAKEAGATWQDFTKEKGLRERLEQMAQVDLDFEKETNLLLDLSPIEEKRRFIQEQTIDILSRDEDVRSEIAQVNNYKEALQKAQQDDVLQDAQRLRDMLSTHSEFLQRQDGSLVDELYARSASGQQEKVRTMLGVLEAQAKNPDFIWQRFVNKGYVSKEVIDSFDEIVTLTELQETANVLSDYSKSAKAKHLLPFLEKGISAGILMEMVEGRYDLPDNLIAKHIDSLIHFSDIYNKELKKQPRSLKKKLVTSAIAIAAAGIITLTPDTINRIDPSQDPSQSQAEQMIEEQEYPQEDQEEDKQTDQQEDDGYSTLGDVDSIKPKNDSIESFKKGKESVVWSLTGNNLSGFYRDKTASYFDPSAKRWIINKGYIPLDTTKLAQGKADITLSGKLLVTNTTATIPSRDNYLLSLNGFKTEGIVGPVTFSRRADENYIMHFSPENVGKVIAISYSLDKTNKSTLLPPTQQELEAMRQKIVNVSELYGYGYTFSVGGFVSELDKRTDLSNTDKAKKLEAFVKDELNYSLDPHYSNIYHREKDNAGFINEIFKIGKVDCDVANTALVALLRSTGIPSRMAYGFANTGVLDKDNRRLVGTEGHGWVEAYVDGKWISLDGTPTRMDFETQKELEKGGNENGQSEADGEKQGKEGEEPGAEGGEQGKEDGQSEAKREKKGKVDEKSGIKPEDLGLKEWDYWAEGEVPWKEVSLSLLGIVLAAEALGLGTYGVSRLVNRKNEKLASRLKQDLDNRANIYFGGLEYGQRITEIESGNIEKSRGHNNISRNDAINLALLPISKPLELEFDIKRAFKLRKMLKWYKKGKLPKEKEDSPDVLDFLTEVLGHGEKETKKRLYDDAYREASSQFASEYFDVADEITEELHMPQSFVSRCAELFVTKLFDKRLPNDEQDFNQRKTEAINSLYGRYQKERVTIVRQKNNITNPPDFTIEEFGKSMERLIGFKTVERQMLATHEQAMKSVSRRWNDRLMFRE